MVKSKAKKIEECVVSLDIEVPKETIEQAFVEVYGEIAKVATIPGFRAGKAPQDLVKKHYAKDAREEALKHLIPDSYRKAVEEHKLAPIGMPAISDVNFEEGKLLTFKASVTTRPDFKLKDYKGLKVDRKKTAVKPADIEKTIESLREMHAKYQVADDRPVQMGDYVTGDLDCFVDGKPAHKKRENIWFAVEKDSFIPGLTEKMVGMKKDEERDVEVTLPEKYPDKALAGKLARYHVTVKGIKVRQLPAVDDEFAKDLGKETLAALKEDITKELDERMRSGAEVETENQLLARLAQDNVFAVPASFVKRQIESMVENSKQKLIEKGFKKEELDKKDDEFRAKYKDDAVRQVRLLFILDEIAGNEKIEVTEADLASAFASIAARAGRTEKEVKDYYEKEEMLDSLAEKIREEKTIEFLLKHADITEKDS